jgi:hypothetical protein
VNPSNLFLDNLDIWVYPAIVLLLNMGYISRIVTLCTFPTSKKKLDSQKRGLLSFSEIAVHRALNSARLGLKRSRWLLTRKNGKGGDGRNWP